MEKKIRKSNFELLRIIAMIMIIMHHIELRGAVYQLTVGESARILGNGHFNNPVFYKQLLVLANICPMGKIGDAIFILITGYFMITKGLNIDLKKVTSKLLLQVGYAALVLTVLPTVIYKFTDGMFIERLFAMDIFHSMAWFVGYYISIITIAYLFLNKFLINLSQKNYTIFLLVMFAIVELNWTNELLRDFSEKLLFLLTGIFIYSFGAYIQLYNPFEKVRGYVFILVIIAVMGLICLSEYNVTRTSIEAYAKLAEPDIFIQWPLDYYENSISVLIVAGALFELFRRLSIPGSKIINYIGSATFMVYLLHDNKILYDYWQKIDWLTPLYYSPLKYVGMSLMWAFGIMAVGTVFYAIFQFIMKYSVKLEWLVMKKD